MTSQNMNPRTSEVEQTAGEAPPIVEVEGLSFRYRGAEANQLVDVSLVLRSGVATGILGPNGAGKSTLIGALTGVLAGTTGGSIRVDGGGPLRRVAGCATQDTSLYPTLTVRENLTHQAKLLLPPGSVDDAVDFAAVEYELGDLVDQPAYKLSGGQRRLVHLAVSFVHQPPLRILDEPTTALDFETRARVVALVQGWVDQGTSVAVTAHYPEDIEDLCDDLYLLGDRTIRHLGLLADVLASADGRCLLRTVNPSGEIEERRLVDLTAGQIAALVGPEAPIVSIVPGGRRLRDLMTADPAMRSFLDEGER
jgi:ABC-2 type transport system ATP-binding protein